MSTEDYRNKVCSWLEGSEYSSRNPSSGSTRSTTSSSLAGRAYKEPSFPAHFKDSEEENEKEVEKDEGRYATWNSSSAILVDIAKTCEFPSDVKVKRLPVPQKRNPPEEKPLPQSKEHWNDFHYIATHIQKEESPPRSSRSSEEVRLKTAQAWAKPVVNNGPRVKPLNKGRGSLLIGAPENLSTIFTNNNTQAYHNSNIQSYIDEHQFTYNSSDEDEKQAKTSNNTGNNRKGKSATPPKSTKSDLPPVKYVHPNKRNTNMPTTSTSATTGARPKTTAAPGARPKGVYVPPNRRQNRSPSNSEKSATSKSNRTTDEELEQFVFSPKNRRPSNVTSTADAPEFVSNKPPGPPQMEENKPFSLFNLSKSKAKPLPVDVVARRNPTVLKLMGKKDDVDEIANNNVIDNKSPDSTYTTADNFTFSQSSETNASDFNLKLPGPDTLTAEPARPFKPDQNPVLNAKVLSSKLEKLKQERGETEERVEKENRSPDSCINDFSSCSEAELNMDDEEENDGYSSGFSDNIETYVCERQPIPKLKCVTLSSDEDDDRTPVQPFKPVYCPKSSYSIDARWSAGINSHQASHNANNEFNFKPEDFPRL